MWWMTVSSQANCCSGLSNFSDATQTPVYATISLTWPLLIIYPQDGSVLGDICMVEEVDGIALAVELLLQQQSQLQLQYAEL
jgi:hypothetical protein